jgi:CO/xanthine dehydrogenase Mo-binding subunit
MNDRTDLDALALKVVGTRPVRPDGADKVVGRANFGADLRLPRMLEGRVKRSPHAHASILAIDVAAARALPGVKAVVTAADFPDLENLATHLGETATTLRDIGRNVIARDKALYVGHAVAAVAATSAEIADAALALIDVRYEVLPHVIDVEAAMASDAPVLHPDMFTKGVTPAPTEPSNVAQIHRLSRGDAGAAFADPATVEVVVQGRYTTAPVHQGYIEPHACVASAGVDGQHQLWVSTQGQFMFRTLCAQLLAIPAADLRVTPAEIGGGFGGKTTVYLEPLALALSRQAGRPVRMVMGRQEVFEATGPTSGGVMDVKLGARRDGILTAAEVVLKFQAGAFAGAPVSQAGMCCLAAYDIAHVAITGYDVVSNRAKATAYRAPGSPLSAFAVESALDDLASKLGIDPLELRLRNIARNGAKAIYGATFRDIGFAETLEAVREHPHWKAPLEPNTGRGIACGYWFNYGGESSAAVHVSDDGTATVVSSNPDIGGSRASMAMMAAETLGLPIEKVRAVVADTASIGYSFVTGGSRVTFATGMAVVQAAQKVVDDLRRRAAQIWECDASQVVWHDGAAVCTDASRDREPLLLAAIAAKSAATGGPIGAEASLNAQGFSPGFAVMVVDVAVDPDTGRSTVTRCTAAQDVGKAIHPAYVEGQMQGGSAQGIGWALNEEYLYDARGAMLNAGFLDYRMPVASDLPMIDTVIVEAVPNLRHPYGAKGVGEASIVPPLAAVANAVSHAIGRRLYDLPLSPPCVLDAIQSEPA